MSVDLTQTVKQLPLGLCGDAPLLTTNFDEILI